MIARIVNRQLGAPATSERISAHLSLPFASSASAAGKGQPEFGSTVSGVGADLG